MEITSKFKDRDNNTSPLNSPNSHVSSSTSCSSSHVTRSDPNNPYPTTFVTADTSSFKQVVQMLTGSSETTTKSSSSNPNPKNFVIPPIRNPPKKQGFKLYERRNNSSLKNTISPLMAAVNSSSPFPARNIPPEILSPSLLDFPSLTLSPVTPLIEDPFDKSSPSIGNSSEEERAIADKGFYLHPSPISTPRDSEPQLLPLFPLSSPRVPE